jgi:hypothetical protein
MPPTTARQVSAVANRSRTSLASTRSMRGIGCVFGKTVIATPALSGIYPETTQTELLEVGERPMPQVKRPISDVGRRKARSPGAERTQSRSEDGRPIHFSQMNLGLFVDQKQPLASRDGPIVWNGTNPIYRRPGAGSDPISAPERTQFAHQPQPGRNEPISSASLGPTEIPAGPGKKCRQSSIIDFDGNQGPRAVGTDSRRHRWAKPWARGVTASRRGSRGGR